MASNRPRSAIMLRDLLLAALVGTSLAFAPNAGPRDMERTARPVELRALFNRWMATHAKVYASAEVEDSAFETWSEHHAAIEAHNADSTKSFKRAHNEWSDHSNENHVKLHLGHKPQAHSAETRRLAESPSVRVHKRRVESLPAAWDWSEHGKVSSVKNQGGCGCCWAFAASGAIESAFAIENNHVEATTSVSEQQLVSCTNGAMSNGGCNGGSAIDAYAYAGAGRDQGANLKSDGYYDPKDQAENNGWSDAAWTLSDGSSVSPGPLCTCEKYPFLSGAEKTWAGRTMCGHTYSADATSKCNTKSCISSSADSGTCDATIVRGCPQEGIQVSGFVLVLSEEDLMDAVHKTPVSVAINAGAPHFQTYSSGVYDECTSKDQDHAVLVVGWGELDGKKYWKVKNSWGTDWGENGYFRLERGVEMCGIGYSQTGYVPSAAYPTGVTTAGRNFPPPEPPFPPPAPPSPPPPAPPMAANQPYAKPPTTSAGAGKGDCRLGDLNLNKPWQPDPDEKWDYNPMSSQYGNQIIPCTPPCPTSGCPSLGPAPAAQGRCSGQYCVLDCIDDSECKNAGMTCFGAGGGYYGTCVYQA